VRTFALPRLQNLILTKKTFPTPLAFDLSKYLSGNFGVWSYAQDGLPGQVVRLCFTGYVARVVAERQWHANQEVITKRDGSVELRLQVSGWEELTGWILSWGRHARVLEPAKLREGIAAEVRDMRRIHAV
jgi:proteasome accessory factor B